MKMESWRFPNKMQNKVWFQSSFSYRVQVTCHKVELLQSFVELVVFSEKLSSNVHSFFPRSPRFSSVSGPEILRSDRQKLQQGFRFLHPSPRNVIFYRDKRLTRMTEQKVKRTLSDIKSHFWWQLFWGGRRILKQKAHTFLSSQSLLVSILIYTIRYSQLEKKFFFFIPKKNAK